MPYADREKQAAYQRDWYRRHKEQHINRIRNERRKRREVVNEYKLSRGCNRSRVRFPHSA